MTSPALTLGSLLLAFAPSFALLFAIVAPKAQLVILAVGGAFAYLLAAVASSFVWLITSSIGRAVTRSGDDNDGDDAVDEGVGTLLALAIPGVICQTVARCLFVRMYFRVERAIRKSVETHEAEVAAAHADAAHAGGGAHAANGTSDASSPDAADAHAETNALQLQLNDLSCSLATGTGYALFHALLLYGTLLASEAGEGGGYDDSGAYQGGGGSTGHGGTLYQSSCGGMPSLVNGALIACVFSALDVMWTMLCFFGMRRRSQASAATDGAMGSGGGVRGGRTSLSLLAGLACRGFDDSSAGGTAAIAFVVLTHLAASLVLAPNAGEDGCKISLPCLGGMALWVAAALWRTARNGRFLPEDQRRRIRGMQLGLRTVDQSHHVE